MKVGREIVDINNLSEEEEKQFLDDLWDCGIPPQCLNEWRALYEKWRHKVDLPEPTKELFSLFKR